MQSSKEAGRAGPLPSLGRSNCQIRRRSQSNAPAFPISAWMWDPQQVTSSTGGDPALPGWCPSLPLNSPVHTAGPSAPKVSTRPPPRATCASSGDGHTCAEDAVPASGNWDPLRSFAGPSTRGYPAARTPNLPAGPEPLSTPPLHRQRGLELESARHRPPSSAPPTCRQPANQRPAP